ncbi:hypothetical protein [Streptomyces sp. AK02-01A]|uniref:hypothetical protein n=1 Tax=Streptomyces sp. AK02-01A TaxID=3028648 RepID=UPI0029BC1144|nr:hypothetical protein [Streptomyces sp. AK02-01A]MDX3850629.1 hypothetical protein [Streptomyces sp. AK02-01A]
MSLPGADELFRTTGGTALQSSSPADRRRNANGEPRVPPPAGESGPAGETAGSPASAEEHSAASADSAESPRSRTADAEQAAASVKGRRPQDAASTGAAQAAAQQGGQQRRRGRGANRRPSGRERHDEKITVYVSAEELMDLEHARLVLRGEHGLAVDRGRIVREAVAVVLADLESRGDASILVRRLRGR